MPEPIKKSDSFKATDSFVEDSFKPDDALAPKPASEAFAQPQGSAGARVAGGLWGSTLGGLTSGVKMGLDLAQAAATRTVPSAETNEAIARIGQAHATQAKEAKEAWNRPGIGGKVEAVGHGLAASLPIVGPAAAHAAERIAGTAPTLDRYGNVIEQGRAPDIAGGLAEGAGLIVSSSPRNIPLVRRTIQFAKKAIPERVTPEGMYQSALRPSLAKKNIPKIDKEVATGLSEGIPVSESGLNRLEGRIEDINTEIANRVATESQKQGATIRPLDVTKPVNRLKPTFAEQVNPEADINAINRSKAQFLEKHTERAPYTKVAPGIAEEEGRLVPVGKGETKIKKNLTLSEAQKEKQGTYRQLRKKYGELGSADVEAQKALARGLKDEIAKRVPGIAELNARDSALIDLHNELDRMVAREGNKNLLGLVPATMSRDPVKFLATLLLDNPAIKSRVAIALDRARRAGNAMPSLPVGSGGIASMIGANANNEMPQYAKGAIVRKPTVALIGEAGTEVVLPIGHIRRLGPMAQKKLLRGIGSHLGIGAARKNKSTLGAELARGVRKA